MIWIYENAEKEENMPIAMHELAVEERRPGDTWIKGVE